MRVYGVGLACLDIVNEIPSFPAEDGEASISTQRLARGGNCTNTLCVLSQLGHSCSWGGLVGNDDTARHILDNLSHNNVSADMAIVNDTHTTSTSYIMASTASASRTIFNRPSLAEFSYDDFVASTCPSRHTCSTPAACLWHESFDWIHFEGRNVADTLKMMTLVRQQLVDGSSTELAPVVSVDIEKPKRTDSHLLVPLADVVFFSKDFALRCSEYDGPEPRSAETFLRSYQRFARPGSIVSVTWGEDGAFCITAPGDVKRDDNEDMEVVHQPCFPPPSGVVDTVGAGDTYSAAFIDARLRGKGLGEAVAWGCRVAGLKCGCVGLDGVGELVSSDGDKA